MRKFILFFAIHFIAVVGFSQFVYKIKADSVLITNDSCSAELNLENSTKSVKGFLYNKGNGRTEFRRGAIKLNDSMYLVGGDTINLSNNSGTTYAAGNGMTLTGNTFSAGGSFGSPIVYTGPNGTNYFAIIDTGSSGFAKMYLFGKQANLNTSVLDVVNFGTGVGTIHPIAQFRAANIQPGQYQSIRFGIMNGSNSNEGYFSHYYENFASDSNAMVTSFGNSKKILWVRSNGSVGIQSGTGTMYPTATLHVDGTVRLQNLTAAITDSTSYKPVVIDASGNIYKSDGWPAGGGGATPAGNFGNLQINRNGVFNTPGSDSLDFESASGLSVKGDINSTALFKAPNGGNGTPSYTFTNSTSTGMHHVGSNILGLNGGGSEAMRLAAGDVWNKRNSFILGVGADLSLNNEAAAILQLGVDAATPIAQTLKAFDGSGTDKAGSNLIIAAGRGTGTGGGGSLLFQTGPASTSGSSQIALATIMQISNTGNIVLGNTAALATNATNGFIYLPTSAGTPTGVPTSYTGKAAYQIDVTNNIPYFYNGAWKASVTTDATQTLTNKRITPRVQSVSSSSTVTPNIDNDDAVVITALAETLTIANPSGTPTEAQPLTIRIKDDGTARTISFGSNYRASSDLPLPTTTIISKTLYLRFLYNAADSKYDLVALVNNF